jgi:hypothetical protein
MIGFLKFRKVGTVMPPLVLSLVTFVTFLLLLVI